MEGKPCLFKCLKQTTTLNINQRWFKQSVHRADGGGARDVQLVRAKAMLGLVMPHPTISN